MKNTKTSLPVYPSMQACAGATGIPLAVLKRAKKDGCPAFHASNRVELAHLLPWLFTKGESATAETFDEAELREKIARADLLELERKQKSGELINVDDAIARVAEIVQPVARMVKDMPARLCQRCNPNDPQLARQVLEDYARDICDKVQEVK